MVCVRVSESNWRDGVNTETSTKKRKFWSSHYPHYCTFKYTKEREIKLCQRLDSFSIKYNIGKREKSLRPFCFSQYTNLSLILQKRNLLNKKKVKEEKEKPCSAGKLTCDGNE